jgi:pyruvate formate lyase activating enzyme
MEIESRLYQSKDGRVKCQTCAHYCEIRDGRKGICRVRENRDGTLFVLNYGVVSSIHPDPIEKKPLHNFKPGTYVLSLGGVSCNFRCEHCQNYSISFANLDFPTKYISPETVVEMVGRYNCEGIALTYNEPSIWHEYAEDCFSLAIEKGMYTVYVTNGYMSKEAIKVMSDILNAANVDVKAFQENFYRKVCGGSLEKVLENIKLMEKKGIFLELTYLVIPSKNDNSDEIREFTRWVADLNKRIPVHFSRFHPDYKVMDIPPTPIETLEMAYEIAKEEGVEYVYLGNVFGHKYENTYCPNCGEMVIERRGFEVVANLFKTEKCPFCGYKNNIIL